MKNTAMMGPRDVPPPGPAIAAMATKTASSPKNAMRGAQTKAHGFVR